MPWVTCLFVGKQFSSFFVGKYMHQMFLCAVNSTFELFSSVLFEEQKYIMWHGHLS